MTRTQERIWRLVLFPVLFGPILLIGCSSPGGSSSQESAPADLVIRGGYLIDMASNEATLRPIRGLVVAGGRIQRILAAGSNEALPDAAQVIDAESLYLLPGFVDAHVHFRPWLPEPSLHYGVTTLMDTGPCGDNCEEDANEWILRYQRSLNAPDSNGPALYITGKKLAGPANRPDQSVYKLQSAAEATERIDFLAGLGVNGIKAEESLPIDFLKKVIEEANRRGLPVVGHSRDAREAISVGMKFIEHMYPVTRSLSADKAAKDPDPAHLMDLGKVPEFADFMIDHQVYLNPTMLARYGFLSERARAFYQEDKELLATDLFRNIPAEFQSEILNGDLRGEKMPSSERQKLQEGLRNVNYFIREFSARGGLLLAATDTGDSRVPGISMHRELQLLVDAGVTPYRALLGATRFPAELMKKADSIGTVQEGRQADVLLISSNPLENIAATRDIRYVIRKGIIQRKPSQ